MRMVRYLIFFILRAFLRSWRFVVSVYALAEELCGCLSRITGVLASAKVSPEGISSYKFATLISGV